MRYRPYLTSTGEPLFAVTDPFDMLERAHRLSLDLGVPRHETWLAAVSCIPLPAHDPARGLHQGPPGSVDEVAPKWRGWPHRWPDGRLVPAWPHADPAMLWNPLWWLPNHLAGTLDVVDEDTGEVRPEDLSLWAVRVVLDLHSSGLYVPGRGWLDVLELVGIDTTTTEGLQRVTAWLQGTPDDVLDGFSLEDRFGESGEVDSWTLQGSYDLASELGPVLLRANLALCAHRVLEYCEDVDDEDVNLFLSEVESFHRIWLPGLDFEKVRNPGVGRSPLDVLREHADEQFLSHEDAVGLLDRVASQVPVVEPESQSTPPPAPSLGPAWS